MDSQAWFNQRQSRRSVLRKLGMVAGASLLLDESYFTMGLAEAASAATGNNNPINHILIACQENRTFDEYYGYYPHAGSYGISPGYYQPDGKGGKVYPYHFMSPITPDVSHSWQSIHSEWDHGAMDGVYTTDGTFAMGYYDSSDLQYYYSLADAFTLCGNYFCYQLGPTLPNRLALWTGTCGGNTTNNINGGQLKWLTIADLLDRYHITWKCYNLGLGTGSETNQAEGYNALAFFTKWVNDPRLYYQEADYHNDLQSGRLPQVSFLITESLISEHPPADIQMGQSEMQEVIAALMQSPYWTSSALFFTYDEGGGYFDHVAPPQFDAYGLGFRVPTLVISPYVKRGYVSGQLYEHSSVLKFIERRFGLPSLASLNHKFDVRTPGKNNDAALGNKYGPPAPPRDGLTQIGDFYEAFDFTQNPHYYPSLHK